MLLTRCGSQEKLQMFQRKSLSLSTIIIFLLFASISIGLLSFTVFPSVALYLGLITGDEYVAIVTKFYEVLQNGTSIIPGIISMQ